MLTYPGFDPIAFQVGRVKVHWYGIMYLLGFAGAWWLARRRAAKPGSTWKADDVDDLIFFCMLGVILGGRIGYILFYGLKFWAADPWYPLKIWGRRHVLPRRAARGSRRDDAVRLAARAQRRGRLRLHRAAAGARAVLRPHWQLHQQRAVGQGHDRPVGISRRRPGTPSVAAVRGLARRAAAVRRHVGVHLAPTPAAGAVGAVPGVLRPGAFPGGVRAGAR